MTDKLRDDFNKLPASAHKMARDGLRDSGFNPVVIDRWLNGDDLPPEAQPFVEACIRGDVSIDNSTGRTRILIRKPAPTVAMVTRAEVIRGHGRAYGDPAAGLVLAGATMVVAPAKRGKDLPDVDQLIRQRNLKEQQAQFEAERAKRKPGLLSAFMGNS